ncbi:MAG TPA: hypothetical protein VFW16_14785 [Streptosporangiaceae bacterium]|nr:hypothetical protein [Streptosporangiaceae bacterium]
MTDTDLEQRLHDLRQRDLGLGDLGLGDFGPAGTAAAWREFQALRSRSVTTRRRALAVATAAALAGLVVAVPALSGAHRGGNGPQPTSTTIPASPPNDQNAVAARIPMSGVMAVVGDAGHAWVVRAQEQPGLATTYQLAGIDLAANSIMFRTSLGRQMPAIAAGAGRLWLTTPYGEPRGQVVRVDLATGQVLSVIHLHAGRCSQLAFGAGHVYAACGDIGSSRTEFWRINAFSQKAVRLTSPMRGYISSLVYAPPSLWYVTNYESIRGLSNVNGVPGRLVASDHDYQQILPGGQSLVYGDGALWALSGGERLARIDPSTGKVLRRFTYRNYDPSRAGGLDFLAAGDGWLWFLDNGYPFSGVLRVSESTGRPAGGVRVPPNSCGQEVCSQIFYTQGAVWVPTAEYLIRIETSRLHR